MEIDTTMAVFFFNNQFLASFYRTDQKNVGAREE